MQIIGIIIMVLGAVFVIMGIYNRVVYKNGAESGTWVRTTARIVGEYTYTETPAPRLSRGYRSQSNPVTRTQARIVYTVDGKDYEKTVFTNEEDHVDIYYKKKDPSYFETIAEYDARKGLRFGSSGLIFSLVTGAVIIAFGACMTFGPYLTKQPQDTGTSQSQTQEN